MSQGLPLKGVVDCMSRCMFSRGWQKANLVGAGRGSDDSKTFGSSPGSSGSSSGSNFCHTQLSLNDPLVKYAEAYCQTYDEQIGCNKVSVTVSCRTCCVIISGL
jgi:hypothetical protein